MQFFLDSGDYRKTPFTFLKFSHEGFYYNDAFILGYKIRAIKNRDTKQFLVNRGFDTEKLVPHKWPDIPPFPPLKTYVPTTKLYRYAAYFLRTIEKKLHTGKKQEEISAYFGHHDSRSHDAFPITLINEQGPFQNTVVTNQKMYRGLPTSLKIEKAKSFYPYYTQALVFDGSSSFSLVELNDTWVKISNGTITSPRWGPSPHSNQKIVHYIVQNKQRHRIGYTDSTTHHFKFFKHTLETMEGIRKETLSSIGWRNEDKIYFLHDFDYIPLHQ